MVDAHGDRAAQSGLAPGPRGADGHLGVGPARARRLRTSRGRAPVPRRVRRPGDVRLAGRHDRHLVGHQLRPSDGRVAGRTLREGEPRSGRALYPVGTADEGATLLGLGEDGSLHLLRDRAEFLSTTTDQALDRLVDMQATASALWKPSGGAADDHAFWRRVDTVDPAPDTTSPRWPAETDRVLRAAGWSPGRAVPTDTWESLLLETGGFELHDAARRFLAEFGALRVPHREPWDEMPWRSSPWTPCWPSGTRRSSKTCPTGRVRPSTPSACTAAATRT